MELNPILSRIDLLKTEAENIKPAKPEFKQAFWNKYRLEFNYNSNHIEGNTLTYGHTQLLLLFDKVTGDYSLRELEEMKAHDTALKLVTETAADAEHQLSEKFIREINEMILVRPFYKEAITPDGQPTRRLIEPGNYKKYPNSVRLENGEIFNYASPEETPAMMGDLMDWYRKEIENKELHPVQIAALFHYRFVRIHPFDDSNGRTARLMMNYILMKCGYAPLVIESAGKKDYLFALNEADTGNINAFVDYILKLAERWQEIFLKAFKGEKVEEMDDYKKEIELLKRKWKSLDDRIELTISNDVLTKVFTVSIIPLINKIYKELSTFDDFFLSKKVRLLSYSPARYININSFNEIPAILSEVTQSAIKDNAVSFKFYYEHLQLRKKNYSDFEFESAIQFSFNKYNYEITIAKQKEIILKKYYHQEITQEETTELASLMAKIELDKIKEVMERNHN